MSCTFKQYPRIAITVILAGIVSACEQSRLPDVGQPSREPLILHSSLRTRINIVPNLSTARNVILFIGDGMGVTTVTAARIFDGQSKGMSGEENVLPFETFPNVALIKTYTANQMVADSAGSATAMNTGVKTRAGVIGIGPQAYRRSCEGALAYPLTTLGEMAEQNGKATGIVTTARITHATPAAVYAHSAERYWESDRFLPEADWEMGCRDIAYQLAHFSSGDGIEVMFGGGRREFYGSDFGGNRLSPEDDLVSIWAAGGSNRHYISTARELSTLKADEQVLGLFSSSHMTFVAERESDTSEPGLAEMTAKAIELLAARENGYFLMVEGARIDHGHHDGIAGYALLETQEFARAVATALEVVDLSDTLVLVTADHSHTLTLGGYTTRGNPILGLVVGNDVTGRPDPEPHLADDGLPYSVLSYANGPGGLTELPRTLPQTNIDTVQQALVPLSTVEIDGRIEPEESHGGEDVALYANGPWSHLVGGVLEQNAIFHIISYAFAWDRNDNN
ncbi:MAG: alkaline phosphatase [Proteobacteria bacterium]|nr:alkaline phosphatase [Pseudomonadota bacterium]